MMIWQKLGLALAMAAAPAAALAEEAPAAAEAAAPAAPVITAESLSFVVNNLWIMIAAALVFIMHLGFASLEAGFSQSKSTTSVLFKNIAVLVIGLLTYALVGFSIMYPGAQFAGGFFGFSGFGISPGPDGLTPTYNANYTYYTDFLFQAMFAATAATIVSGAVAERIRLSGFLIFSTLLVALAYPIVGMWKWGGGFLQTMSTPFYDFAGSTIVHSVGGWAALVGAIVLGPRLGKFVNGKPVSLRPSNLPLATTGVFFLWLGWFGFNGGSVLSANPAAVSLVLVTTCLGAAAGLFTAMMLSWRQARRPDIAQALNGALAGLVGITAGADQFSPLDAVMVGGIAGLIVVLGASWLEKSMKIDDPVGAVPVHLMCGIWGTLAVGLFGNLAGGAQFMSQLIGVAAVGVAVAAFSAVAFYALKRANLLRVSEDAERRGLDVEEYHPAYDLGQNEEGRERSGRDHIRAA